MESENTHDFDTTIATFSAPRYELMATGEVFEGEEAVRQYYARSRATFPDQRNENTVLHHMDDGVLAEFDLCGTHARSGKEFRSRMAALFLFDDDDLIVCERVYFDSDSIRRQLS